MIPRPLTDDAARYNPGRWICTMSPEQCGGVHRVYSQDMPCPLYTKCLQGNRTMYEYSLGAKVNGLYLALHTDVNRRQRTTAQNRMYKRLFGGIKSKPLTPEQRAAATAWMREKRRREREANPKPMALPERPLLPCGEDCAGGCPYDGPCPYTDADIDALVAKAAHDKYLAQKRAAWARAKARMAENPEYRARQKELEKVRRKRYCEAHKAELQAAARERWRLKNGYYQRHKEDDVK